MRCGRESPGRTGALQAALRLTRLSASSSVGLAAIQIANRLAARPIKAMHGLPLMKR
jgi:NADPH:quinone reductase-like Zn-dependent oxidoreductase